MTPSRRRSPITDTGRRRAATRPLRRRVLIVTEGRVTESSYFNELRRRERLTAAVVIRADKSDPLGLVQDALDARDDAIETGAPYDSVWCVFDTEAPEPHNHLGEAIAKAERSGVFVARSNPCFELWLLLHVSEKQGYMTTRQACSALAAQGILAHGEGCQSTGVLVAIQRS